MGLQSLHGHGMNHGEICPVCQRLLCILCCSSESLFFILQKNILRSKGHCYLSGFDISESVDHSPSFSFAPAVAKAQRAPDQIDGSVTWLDQNTDIFSFGSTMYQVFWFS
jgi:hypothetical protein